MGDMWARERSVRSYNTAKAAWETSQGGVHAVRAKGRAVFRELARLGASLADARPNFDTIVIHCDRAYLVDTYAAKGMGPRHG